MSDAGKTMEIINIIKAETDAIESLEQSNIEAAKIIAEAVRGVTEQPIKMCYSIEGSCTDLIAIATSVTTVIIACVGIYLLNRRTKALEKQAETSSEDMAHEREKYRDDIQLKIIAGFQSDKPMDFQFSNNLLNQKLNQLPEDYLQFAYASHIETIHSNFDILKNNTANINEKITKNNKKFKKYIETNKTNFDEAMRNAADSEKLEIESYFAEEANEINSQADRQLKQLFNIETPDLVVAATKIKSSLENIGIIRRNATYISIEEEKLLSEDLVITGINFTDIPEKFVQLFLTFNIFRGNYEKFDFYKCCFEGVTFINSNFCETYITVAEKEENDGFEHNFAIFKNCIYHDRFLESQFLMPSYAPNRTDFINCAFWLDTKIDFEDELPFRNLNNNNDNEIVFYRRSEYKNWVNERNSPFDFPADKYVYDRAKHHEALVFEEGMTSFQKMKQRNKFRSMINKE